MTRTQLSFLLAPMVFVVIALAQVPPMPPPGNPGHQEPPPGAFCQHPSVDPDPAHACECQKACQMNEDGSVTIIEDRNCRAWCFKRHCHCPHLCP